jgi:hypothetical protein
VRLDHVTLCRVTYKFCSELKLHTSLPDDNSSLVPPDPISNSEVKRTNANGSAGLPCVRVGNRQAFCLKPFKHCLEGFFFAESNNGYHRSNQ